MGPMISRLPVATACGNPPYRHVKQGGAPVAGPAKEGWLDGKREILVYPPEDPDSEPIVDIDLVRGDVLWELKSAERIQFSAEQRQRLFAKFPDQQDRDGYILSEINLWAHKHIDEKIERLAAARAVLPHYEKARLGYCFVGPTDAQLKQKSQNEGMTPEDEDHEIELFTREVRNLLEQATDPGTVHGIGILTQWDESGDCQPSGAPVDDPVSDD